MSLDALQSRSDKIGDWIASNPTPILGALGGILAIALVVGLIGSSREGAVAEAADQLSRAQRDFRVAMGVDATAIDIPEPANPEAARTAREAAVVDLQAVIDDHGGSPAAAIAALELGDILIQLDRAGEAIPLWETAAGNASGSLRGMLLQRIGTEAELGEDLAAAADAYERASAIDGYPLRHLALAEAARVHATRGEDDAAVALLERLETEAPDFAIPEHVEARLSEIRASRTD